MTKRKSAEAIVQNENPQNVPLAIPVEATGPSEGLVSQNGGKKSAKHSKKLVKFGGISLVVLATAFVWATRMQVAQFGVENYLRSKGVNGAIVFSELGTSGASFTNLRVGPSGHETLMVTNGHISWRYDWTNRNFVIEELRASQLRGNLGIKNGKIDFGALAPLMKGGGQKLQINQINLDLGEISLQTEYGEGRVNLALGGAGNDFAGEAEIILPHAFYLEGVASAPIKVKFNSKELNEGRIKAIGARIDAQQQNLDFSKLIQDENIKNFQAKGLRSDITLGLAINDGGQTYIAVHRSFLSTTELKIADANLDGFNINLSQANWQHKNNWAEDAVFDLAAQIRTTTTKIGQQTISNSEWNLRSTRDANKHLDVQYSVLTQGMRGAILGRSLNLRGELAGVVGDLSKIGEVQFAGDAQLEARAISLSEAAGLKEIAANLHASELLSQANVDLHFGVVGNRNGIAFTPIGNQKLFGHRNSEVVFTPIASSISTGNIFAHQIDGNVRFSGGLAGKIDFRPNATGRLSAQLNEGSFANGQTRIELSHINLQNLKYGQFTLDGNGGRAQLALARGRVNSGRISASLMASSNGDLKMAKSPIALDVSVQNNHAEFTAHGRIADASFDNNRISNAGFQISGNAQIANGHLPISVNSNARMAIGRFVSKDGARAHDFSISGPFQTVVNTNYLAFGGRQCLNTSINEIALDDNQISNAQGTLCPDRLGRFATIENGRSHLYAVTNVAALDLRLGSSDTANHIALSGLTGSFGQAPGGGILYVASVPNLEFRFNTGPTTKATIHATDSRLVVHSRAGATEMTADLREIRTEGLPVRTSGNMILDMSFTQRAGTIGHFSFNNLFVGDTQTAKRYSDLALSGTGDLENNQIHFEGNLAHAQSGAAVAVVRLNHNLQSGVGNAVFDGNGLRFKPASARNGPRDGFEIGEILPPLQGIFSDVEGGLTGQANFNWAPNQPVISSAQIAATSLNFNTIIGQVENIAGTVRIDDLLALRTSTQIIRVGSFNPGIPILNGVLGFSLPGTDELKIEAASWPFADGELSIIPSIWPFNNQDKTLTIKVDNIDIAQLLRLTNIPNLVIDGRMSGVLPVKIIENNAEIVGGILRAREGGGTIKYTGPSFAGATPPPTGREKLQRRFGMPTIPKNEALAEAALRNLQYKVLEIRVDGRITGDMTLGMTIEGFNPDLLSATQFRFNVNFKLPIGQIMSSIKNTADPCKQIEGRNIEELSSFCPQEPPTTNPDGIF